MLSESPAGQKKHRKRITIDSESKSEDQSTQTARLFIKKLDPIPWQLSEPIRTKVTRKWAQKKPPLQGMAFFV